MDLLLILIHLLLIKQDIIQEGGQPPIKDGEGNVYESVVLGTQEWLTQDLRTTRYNDGEPIPVRIDAASLSKNLWIAGMSWYNYDSTAQVEAGYGALYNWYAVNTGKLCPAGWHVPTDEEWTILIQYLDTGKVNPDTLGKSQSNIAGGKMKEAGYDHWAGPNTNASNTSGWTALAGGYGINDGGFYRQRFKGIWWSSTEAYQSHAYARSLRYKDGNIARIDDLMSYFFSVRCLKD
ncbi:MAG: fibrobacter succinogenes major paralogous domain-containing protein [Bacteroidota bacterium]